MNAKLVYSEKRKAGKPSSVDHMLDMIKVLEDASPGKFKSMTALCQHFDKMTNHVDNIVAGVYRKMERDVLEHFRRGLRKHGLMSLGLEKAIRDLGGKVDFSVIPENVSPSVKSKFKLEHENPSPFKGNLSDKERQMIKDNILKKETTPEDNVLKFEQGPPSGTLIRGEPKEAPNPNPEPENKATAENEMTPRKQAFQSMIALSKADRTVVIDAIMAYDKL